jgi:hypothetical protein
MPDERSVREVLAATRTHIKVSREKGEECSKAIPRRLSLAISATGILSRTVSTMQKPDRWCSIASCSSIRACEAGISMMVTPSF